MTFFLYDSYILIHGPNIPDSYAFQVPIALYSIGPCLYHQSHPQLDIVFALALSLHFFWSYFSTDLQLHIGLLPTWGVPFSVSYHFAFSYCSWGSQGKNTEVVCHSLLQWTTFCQTSAPWPAHLGWPHRAWLNFIELDKAVVLVWLHWLVFCDYGFSVSVLYALSQHLLSYLGFSDLERGVSLHAAPANSSRCSLPWTRGISSRLPLLTLNVCSLVTNIFTFIDIMHKMTLAYLACVTKTVIDK